MTPSSKAGRDAEFELCVACCRWPQDAAAAAARVRACAAGVDWERLQAMVRRHRVQGLVHRALRTADVSVPSPARETLAGWARGIAFQNIAMATEYLALDAAFAAAEIPRLFVKGLTLATLAYGELGVKANHDIDILVAPDDLAAAISVIEARGYCLIVPANHRARIQAWHRYSKESTWRHVDSGRMIDLHTALTDSPMTLTGMTVHAPSQRVDIAGSRGVATLANDDLFAYLAIHGASSGWSRLKWIADFAALFGGVDGDELLRLHTHAAGIGAGRATALAILLVDRLFGLQLTDDIRHRLTQERVIVRLVERSMTLMQGRRIIKDVTETRFGTVPIHRIHLAMRPEWRYKADVLRGRIGTRFF